MTSSLERTFETRWRQLAKGAVELTPQSYFHPTRDWRFDFCDISHLVYVELHGGGWVNGRHNREAGMVEDFSKYNAAVLMGWRGIYATTSMIENDPASVIEPLLELISQPVLSLGAERSMWIARLRNLTKPGSSILNNGIRIERGSGAKFVVVTASGTYKVGGSKLKMTEARQQVLDLILKTQKKPSPITTGLASRTQFTTNLIAEKLG